jgi:1-hydroxycarotenoid 3,4-desaturase
MGWSALTSLRSIDPFETMESAIVSRVEDEKLRHILRRFATYVGSDPRQAPATLNCIAWLEIGTGGYGVEGGMHKIAKSLVEVARDRGTTFHFDEPVKSLEMEGNRVTGVRTDDDTLSADIVISNADVSHLSDYLLPENKLDRAPKASEELSMSGWTAVVKARRLSYVDRPAHQVLFPTDYEQEFIDIFQRNQPPSEPTVYLCAQEKAHDREGWERQEPIFIMANAPPEPEEGRRDPAVWDQLADTMLERAVDADLLHPDDEIIWERTPADLAERYPGTRGALYGASSNSPMAAFNRPANEPHRLDGLLLCGGSVHPGGGVPLCLQSGRLAASIALDERPPDLFPR